MGLFERYRNTVWGSYFKAPNGEKWALLATAIFYILKPTMRILLIFRGMLPVRRNRHYALHSQYHCIKVVRFRHASEVEIY